MLDHDLPLPHKCHIYSPFPYITLSLSLIQKQTQLNDPNCTYFTSNPDCPPYWLPGLEGHSDYTTKDIY